jgi:hypothetical protein
MHGRVVNDPDYETQGIKVQILAKFLIGSLWCEIILNWLSFSQFMFLFGSNKNIICIFINVFIASSAKFDFLTYCLY